MANGILDEPRFTSAFSCSDQRSLKDLKQWGTSLKTLITDVHFSGGRKYKDFVSEIENAIELTGMLLEEDVSKRVSRKLTTLQTFFQMCHKLLNIHEVSAGAGNVMHSLIQSQEYRHIFGEFEAELTAQSHKMVS